MVDEYFSMTAMPKERDIMVKTYEMQVLIATNQTGRFPLTSSRGSKYLMVMCEIDGNVILVCNNEKQNVGGNDKSLPFLDSVTKKCRSKAKASDIG